MYLAVCLLVQSSIAWLSDGKVEKCLGAAAVTSLNVKLLKIGAFFLGGNKTFQVVVFLQHIYT